MSDNICAVATAYGTGAISVIRCSGPDAVKLVNRVFKGKNLEKCLSHTIHYGFITDDTGAVIDEVVCNLFLAPKSFDGENTVEINCHGGIYVTNCVLEILLKNGFRMAEAGEFTKRAFLNRRLDLTQAEAVMDIISSANALALKSSANALRSATSKLIKEFREKLLDILAKIEVNIDYPEYEDSVEVTHEYLQPVIEDMLSDMKIILDNSAVSALAIHGIKTAIVGKPNVGKSSLLNMLLDEDKAIVSSVAGTTRDLVEGTLNLRNITLHLIDTAGIRESKDYVEAIGIERSRKAIEAADLVLVVLDSSRPLEEEDYRLLKLTESKKRILVANKRDLAPAWQLENTVYISAEKKEGLSALTDKIYAITDIGALNIDEGRYLNNARQTALMDRAFRALENARSAVLRQTDIDLIGIDIKEAFDALGEITGEAYPEELITALFSKFCLGK